MHSQTAVTRCDRSAEGSLFVLNFVVAFSVVMDCKLTHENIHESRRKKKEHKGGDVGSLRIKEDGKNMRQRKNTDHCH